MAVVLSHIISSFTPSCRGCLPFSVIDSIRWRHDTSHGFPVYMSVSCEQFDDDGGCLTSVTNLQNKAQPVSTLDSFTGRSVHDMYNTCK
jgi:hypothetical protein